MEKSTLQQQIRIVQINVIMLMSKLQFATDLIRSCRVRDTKTPLLQTAMAGADGFLGRPLTDSELAEESMGGMFGGSGTTANTFAYLLWGTLRQPEIVRRLKAELKETFSDDARIPEAAVSLDEALDHIVANSL